MVSEIMRKHNNRKITNPNAIFDRDDGIRVTHEIESMPTLLRIVRDFKPELIIEFGTQFGGFTLCLAEHTDCDIHTFDKQNVIEPEIELHERIHFYQQDIFEKDDNIKELLELPARKLLYCDNGKKSYEVNTFAPHLLSGDLLGIHDWRTEVTPDQVKKTLEDFKPYERDKLSRFLTRFFIRM